MRKVLVIGVLAALALPSEVQAQGWEYDLIRDNPRAEMMYFGWMEAALTPSQLSAGPQLSLRCISLDRLVREEAGFGYCGLHLGNSGRPSVGLGLTMSRNIRPFPDPAVAIDLTFGCVSIVAIFERGASRHERHMFFMLHLDRIWR